MGRYETHDYGNGRSTHKPLAFPDARKVSDVFDAAKLGEGMPDVTTGWHYVGALHGGAFCGRIGGSTYIVLRKGTDELFCLGGKGNVFISTHAKPKTDIIPTVSATMISAVGSFETVVRTDGRVLVTARDDQGIGTRYVALLDAGETLESMFSNDDQQTLAAHRAQRATVESCVRDGRVNVEMAKKLGIELQQR